jgi:hypothetical protein
VAQGKVYGARHPAKIIIKELNIAISGVEH